MATPRTFEIGKWGSHSYCHCTISRAELIHNSLPIDFDQFRCLTDRFVTLANNTKLVRWECDGTITFSTPGIEGVISLSLTEIHYFSEEKHATVPATVERPATNRRSLAMVLLGFVGVCLLVLAIYLRTHG